MDHARKMVLVPHENVERLQAGIINNSILQKPSVKTPGTSLSRLDEEMNAILNSPIPKDEREKWKLYEQVLRRYLHFFDKSNQSPLKIEDKKTNDEEEEEAKMLRNSFVSIITDTVPVRYQRNAGLLLRHLCKLPTTRINWDEHGVLSINGTHTSNLNIIDLVNDAMRTRKQPPAQGRRTFARFLREINTPREYVPNINVWKEGRASDSPAKRRISPIQIVSHGVESGVSSSSSTPDSDSATLLTADDADEEEEVLVISPPKQARKKNTRKQNERQQSGGSLGTKYSWTLFK